MRANLGRVALALALVAALSGCRSARPFELTAAVAAGAAPAPFLAGCATVDFTPYGEPYPLGGYGGGERREEWPLWLGMGWPGQIALDAHQRWHEDDPEGQHDMLVAAEGAHDPLTARALVLRPEGQPPVALVRIDAIAATAELHALAAAAVADLGYRPETVLLSATHTHSGLGAYMRPRMARLIGMDNFRPEVEARIAEACAEAIRAAHQQAVPAALAVARARDRGPDGVPIVASNRRARRFEKGTIPNEAIDDEVGLLHVTRLEDGATLALVVNYAVHCTVFGTEHHRFSADVAGGIERAFSERLGGAPTLFVNGAEGDVRPRSIEARDGWERCLELGVALADMALPALAGAARHERIRLDAALGEKELGSPRTLIAAGRGRFLDGERGVLGWLTFPLTQAVTLPVNLVLWAAGLTNMRLALTWNAGLGVVVHLDDYADRTRFRFGALRLRAGEQDVALLGIPGEATHDVGLALREEARRRGATQTFVLGLTQDHVGYIASRREYRRGGYEAWVTLFGERTADEVLEAERGLLTALGYDGRRSAEPPETSVSAVHDAGEPSTASSTSGRKSESQPDSDSNSEAEGD